MAHERAAKAANRGLRSCTPGCPPVRCRGALRYHSHADSREAIEDVRPRCSNRPKSSDAASSRGAGIMVLPRIGSRRGCRVLEGSPIESVLAESRGALSLQSRQGTRAVSESQEIGWIGASDGVAVGRTATCHFVPSRSVPKDRCWKCEPVSPEREWTADAAPTIRTRAAGEFAGTAQGC